MQSRLLFRTVLLRSVSKPQPSARGLAVKPLPTGKPDDQAVHGDYQPEETPPIREDKAYRPPDPPRSYAPKLESDPVHKPVNPIVQQKRSLGSKVDASCSEIDGWGEDDRNMRQQSEEQEEDDKLYFKDHKASPLSEMEMEDTRKPFTRVVHGTADSYFGDAEVLLWRPEQLDTAEDSLRRATEIWRASAARGVPDWPHSRRLRELRGEDW